MSERISDDCESCDECGDVGDLNHCDAMMVGDRQARLCDDCYEAHLTSLASLVAEGWGPPSAGLEESSEKRHPTY